MLSDENSNNTKDEPYTFDDGNQRELNLFINDQNGFLMAEDKVTHDKVAFQIGVRDLRRLGNFIDKQLNNESTELEPNSEHDQ